ncbi:hypothetical protein V1502_02160 [Bacillus sp. SCS-153A]|uniref:hypothetical protein n=1 Tax=Rossellomorea sedimentorum TaxID=3115294 RepID=UPI003905E392
MQKKIVVLFTVLLLLINTRTSATQWMTLEPEEVVDRADIIVVGQYDFSKDPMRTVRHLYRPYEFKVSKTIKGEAPSTLLAGVLTANIPRVIEYQEQGGEFLLFLEKESHSKHALPVGGPNGTLKLMDGELYHPGFSHKALYEKVERDIEGPSRVGPAVIFLICASLSVLLYFKRLFS